MQNIVYKENIKNFRKPFFLMLYSPGIVMLIMIIVAMLKESDKGAIFLVSIFFIIPLFVSIFQIGPQLIPWYILEIDNQKIGVKLCAWPFFRRAKWEVDFIKIDHIEVFDVQDARFTELNYMLSTFEFIFSYPYKKNVTRIIMGNGPAIQIYTKDNKEFIFSTDNPCKVKELLEDLILK